MYSIFLAPVFFKAILLSSWGQVETFVHMRDRKSEYTPGSLGKLLLPPLNYLAFFSYCTDKNTEVHRAHPRSCPGDTARFSQGLKRPMAWAHSCALLHSTWHGGGLNTKLIWGAGIKFIKGHQIGCPKNAWASVETLFGKWPTTDRKTDRKSEATSSSQTLCLDVLCSFEQLLAQPGESLKR